MMKRYKMNLGFWEKLKRPIMAMAPMANVTDSVFRQLFLKYGAPDIFWTEFVSVEGLLSAGREELIMDFWHSPLEKPIVAQIFGAKPEQFEKVALIVKELGFDGIDINMGCPDKSIEKSGAGANLIKNPKLAREIIRATKKAGLPVSVKTRIGYDKNEIETWLPEILAEGVAALTIHLRTRDEMSDVPAHWELAPQIVEIRNKYSPETILLGNGDVNSLDEAREKIKTSDFDGVMVGRGMFGNPGFFSGKAPGVLQKLDWAMEHSELFEKTYKSNLSREAGELKGFEIMKKHFKAYIAGFLGAKELRAKLMEVKDASEVKEVIEEFKRSRHPEFISG